LTKRPLGGGRDRATSARKGKRGEKALRRKKSRIEEAFSTIEQKKGKKDIDIIRNKRGNFPSVGGKSTLTSDLFFTKRKKGDLIKPTGGLKGGSTSDCCEKEKENLWKGRHPLLRPRKEKEKRGTTHLLTAGDEKERDITLIFTPSKKAIY